MSRNSGATTGGVDEKAFVRIHQFVDSKNRALRVLDKRLEKMQGDINLAKGKTDQAIRRKGLIDLGPREKTKR